MTYDSTEETKAHINNVYGFIHEVMDHLGLRAQIHDSSKLYEPEKSLYDRCKPRIRQAETEFGYGSKEYEDCIKELGPALDHHFENNSHHPEHYPNGISGMSLLDVFEMLSDWKAASMASGQPLNLEANRKRFDISDQLFEILKNTVRELGW